MKHYKLMFTKKNIQNWLMSEVEFLRDDDGCSGSYYKLRNSSVDEPEDLAAVICWEPGFGEEHRDDCIQSSNEPDYALCVGVKIYNPSDIIDIDAWDYPIDKDTNDLLCETISLDESDITDKFSHIADFIIRSYEDCLAYYEEHSDEEIDEALDLSKISSIKSINDLAKGITVAGTYNISDNGELINAEGLHGYQASFFRPEITDEDFKRVLEVIGDKLGKTYLGIYGGNPEMSFNFSSRAKATEFANIFHQESIWDWDYVDIDKVTKEKTLGREIKLSAHPTLVNYDKAIKELSKFLDEKNSEEELTEDKEHRISIPYNFARSELSTYVVEMTDTPKKDESELGIKGIVTKYEIDALDEKDAKRIAKKFDSRKRVIDVYKK